MATYSTNLGLTLLATGEGAGTWGNTTNTNLGTLLEQSISGYEVQSLTSGTTLTLTIPNGASGVARNMYLEFTGNGSTVIVPSNKKLYFVYNNCSSGTITFKVAGQTGVDILKGSKQILVSNGTDIEQAISSLDGVTNTSLTALGVEAGDSITSGANNTAVGYKAGTGITTGSANTFLGFEAGQNITTGNWNTHIGYDAGANGANVSSNTFVGYLCGYNLGGGGNTAMGHAAMQGAGGNSAASNTAMGFQALYVVTTGSQNVAVGNAAGDAVTTGTWNTCIGAFGGSNVSTGGANTLIGYNSGSGVTTSSTNTSLGDSAYVSGNYINSTCLGYNAQVDGSNQVQLGDSNTTTYVYGSVANRASDIRDKADVQDTNLGLNFIMALKPRMYRWDYREDYRTKPPTPPNAADYPTDDAYNQAVAAWRVDQVAWQEANKLANLTHDGTHKRTRFHQGLIAQEVKQTMDAMGVDFAGYQDFKIKGGDDRVTIAYEELISPLIKAIQELKAEFDEYKRTHP
jgi:hypothetical protein